MVWMTRVERCLIFALVFALPVASFKAGGVSEALCSYTPVKKEERT
jgi:hypothetical protein